MAFFKKTVTKALVATFITFMSGDSMGLTPSAAALKIQANMENGTEPSKFVGLPSEELIESPYTKVKVDKENIDDVCYLCLEGPKEGDDEKNPWVRLNCCGKYMHKGCRDACAAYFERCGNCRRTVKKPIQRVQSDQNDRDSSQQLHQQWEQLHQQREQLLQEGNNPLAEGSFVAHTALHTAVCLVCLKAFGVPLSLIVFLVCLGLGLSCATCALCDAN